MIFIPLASEPMKKYFSPLTGIEPPSGYVPMTINAFSMIGFRIVIGAESLASQLKINLGLNVTLYMT
jgi:hypothetical protein